jgi:hypothetical protein
MCFVFIAEQRLLPHVTQTDWFYNRDEVFTPRYELGLYWPLGG